MNICISPSYSFDHHMIDKNHMFLVSFRCEFILLSCSMFFQSWFSCWFLWKFLSFLCNFVYSWKFVLSAKETACFPWKFLQRTLLFVILSLSTDFLLSWYIKFLNINQHAAFAGERIFLLGNWIWRVYQVRRSNDYKCVMCNVGNCYDYVLCRKFA